MSRRGRLLSVALPELARRSPRSRRRLTAVVVFMLAALLLNLAHTGLGLGGERFDVPLNAWLQNVVVLGAFVLVVARAAVPGPERAGWVALAAAIGCWSLGNVYWNLALYSSPAPPFPSPADVGWLLFYPCAYACIALRLRSAARRPPRSLWLDGLVGVLSVGAVGTVLVVAPVLAASEAPRAAVLTNAAYPMADLLLFALCVAILPLQGWRPGRGWLGLAVGFALFAAADSVYLVRLAGGSYAPGGVLDSVWVVGLVVMSLGAWQAAPQVRDVELGGRGAMVPPLVCGMAALVVLLAGSLGRVPVAASYLAAAALLASMVRTALTFADLGRLAEVRRLADTDELTGLSNRRHFYQRRQAALERARVAGKGLALLVIDLDRFKELNDALGHHAGDAVLAQVGPRLCTVLRAEDELARIGGDEFAVLLPGAHGVEAVARRLGEALEERFTIEGIDVRIAASIGIALYPDHGTDAETLLQRADVAMYEAKTTRSGHAFYARERDTHTRERLELIGELRDAIDTSQSIDTSQLILHYQPKLNLQTGAVEDVEALVRWQHPTRGLMAPGEFIPLAEQTGVMRALTDYVLDAALAQCARWRASDRDLGVAINVSPAILFDEAWAARIPGRLERYAVPAGRLRIEITEDAIMLDPERSLAVLRSVAAAGVGVSLDDFGTGYSSLSLLKRLPVDELKVDRSFARDVVRDHADAAIVQTAIDLGRRVGIRVVPEGVEDAATLALITDWGADTAQGLFISPPLPADELEAWLTTTSPVTPPGPSTAPRVPVLADLDARESDLRAMGEREHRQDTLLIGRLRREARVHSDELAALHQRLEAAEHELEDLRAIRDALTPSELPQRPGLQLAAAFLPAEDQVSGDFYLVAEGPRDSTVLVIGDVLGHGLKAGRRAAFVRTTFAAIAPFSDDPCRLLSWANTALVDRAGTSSDFVTAGCVTYLPNEQLVRFAYAGHPPALRMNDGHELAAPSQGLPLGLRTDPEYVEGSLASAEHTGVLLYTDGLTEARHDGRLFGVEGVAAVLGELRDPTASEAVAILRARVDTFARGSLTDDLCMLAACID